ncbi:MAG: rod shape-determining protein MreC [Prevotella sp.]|jgi:rod shape-determining protein MreC|nr:rod shape-determining protein MreC [Prevotella sp.]
MRNLLDFIKTNSHWFLFVALEVFSLVLLFQFNRYQSSVWFTSANTLTGKVYELSSEVTSFFGLSRVNRDLTVRNLYLERQVKQLSEQLLAQTNNDSTLIKRGQLKMLNQFKLIPAKVISNSISRPENFITLDKGSNDGVRPDMGVACGTGVVGIVYLVSPHYSVVIPVLNTKSNISCSVQESEYFGYLHWDGGGSTRAFVDDIPRHAKFKKGQNIVTSGYSAVFPPGIMVGKIRKISNSPDGLSYRLEVGLSTDFGNLRDVCVIDNSDMQERVKLMKAVQDSIHGGKQVQ